MVIHTINSCDLGEENDFKTFDLSEGGMPSTVATPHPPLQMMRSSRGAGARTGTDQLTGEGISIFLVG